MYTIQLELRDELAEKLAPYHDRLMELLELGLQEWLEREQREHMVPRERLLRVLAASDKMKMPRPYTGEKPYVRHTPVPITGRPVSELLIKQRGPL